MPALVSRREPYAYLLPAILLMSLIIIYPVLHNIVMSFQNQHLVKPNTGQFVGLKNYQVLLGDRLFAKTLVNSITYTGVSVAGAFLLGFGVALALNHIRRGRGVLFAVLLVPWVISPVIVGYMWQYMFNESFGLINRLLVHDLGILSQPRPWLGKTSTAMPCVIIAHIWRLFPYVMVMMLAGLQAIPRDLYEAAAVDGADALGRFRHVTLSQLRHVIAVVVLFATIWTFNDFALVYTMTQGGPAHATELLPTWIKKIAFDQFRLGKASALSMVLLVVLLIFTALYVRLVFERGTEEARA